MTEDHGNEKMSPLSAIVQLGLFVVFIFFLLMLISVYFRTPELRNYELCNFPYVLLRFFTVDIVSYIPIPDRQEIQIGNAKYATEFFFSCVDTTSEWTFLTWF